MGLFDRFREGLGAQRPIPSENSADDQAIARYRYMLRTAPPEVIEEAHAEAFAQLTPEQRRRVLEELSNEVPEGERAAVLRAGDSPHQLARVATRSEIRQPGVLERTFNGPGLVGPGLGTLFAGTLLSSMAGTVLGSMIAQQFFQSHPDAGRLGDVTHDDRDMSTRTGDDTASWDRDGVVGSDDPGSGLDGGDTWDV